MFIIFGGEDLQVIFRGHLAAHYTQVENHCIHFLQPELKNTYMVTSDKVYPVFMGTSYTNCVETFGAHPIAVYVLLIKNGFPCTAVPKLIVSIKYTVQRGHRAKTCVLGVQVRAT